MKKKGNKSKENKSKNNSIHFIVAFIIHEVLINLMKTESL